MADGTVQQIKDKLSIVDVVGQYVKLERAGTSLRARCPFHAERTPSFHVSPERGTYHCFGCGVGGDIFTFVQEIDGLDFKGALKVLAEKAGVPLVFEKPEKRDERDRLFELLEVATIFFANKMNDAARTYLTERGMKEDTIQLFRLGWAGNSWSELCENLKSKGYSEKEIELAGMGKKTERGMNDKFRNRIMFPIGDSAGRIIGFSGRSFGADASPEAPKYLNSPETPLFHKSRILYGFDKAKMAIRKVNCAILVEGQMDLLASHQAGWANTLAVSGTAFTQEHASLIKRVTDNMVLALDADEAGIKAAGKAARAALQGGLNVKVAKLPSGLDPADLILKDPEEWRAAIRDSKDIITFLLDVLEEHAKQPDRFRRNVEAVVLPFISDVQSPIEREQYLQMIAKRLGVSVEAVTDAYKKVPHVPVLKQTQPSAVKAPAPISPKADRARQAYAFLIWQKSLARPGIKIDVFAAELERILGKDILTALESLPDNDRESMRFGAELLHGGGSNMEQEAEQLLSVMRKEGLALKLYQATVALKDAEAEGNEAEMTRLMDVTKLLTAQIADQHKAV
jgi:DNA primase